MKAAASNSARQLYGVAREALRQYGLERASVRMVSNVHNQVFRVITQKDGQSKCFALRLHMWGWHSDAAIHSEMSWLESLRRETPLCVPAPATNCAGQLLTHVGKDEAGRRTCTLFPWMSGRILWKRPSAPWLRRIGRLMAELQLHGATFQRPPGFERPRWDAEALVGRQGVLAASWQSLPKHAVRILDEVSSRFVEAAGDIGAMPGSFGLIHGDLHVRNVLSHNDSIAVIDFDDCCDGYYLSDLAAMLDLLEFRSNYRELRQAFLAGYEEVCPLPPGSARHINTFLAARWITICLFLARRPEDEPRLHGVLAMVVPKLKRFLRDSSSLG